MLVDNHNRTINYLRLAVTDRCNLRCNYCMPANGIDFAPNDRLLTIQELSRLSAILVDLGIDKIRITGGEPFVRKGVMEVMRNLTELDGLKHISITTNGTLIGSHIEEMKSLGIRNVNFSLDAVKAETFEKITRRDQFQTVHDNLMRLIAEDFNVKVNFIVLEGQNIPEIIPMLELTKEHDVSVRFLEEMPFNGGSRTFDDLKWNYMRILGHIKSEYPDVEPVPSEKSSTSINYRIKGHKGSFGLIPSFSRTFCGSCNRLRVSATGDLITCLYGKPSANIREAIRGENPVAEARKAILNAVGNRAKNGFEAQERHAKVFEKSMTSIGG